MTDELVRPQAGMQVQAQKTAAGSGTKRLPTAAGTALDLVAMATSGAASGATSGAVSMPSRWSIEVCTDDSIWDRGTELCSQWNRLWERCPRATVFQHSAWLGAWWASYGEPGRLRVVLVRDDGNLVAAAPLRLCRRGPLTVLTLVGNGISDFGTVLVADSGRRSEAVAELRRALAGLHRPIDLRELPPDADALLLADEWPHKVRRWPDSTCLSLPARSFDETVRALPRRTASRVRGKSRKIDALGVLALTTPADQATETIVDLLRLHREQWQDRGISPEHLTERFRAHLTEAVPALITAGHADLIRYELDGELLGCELMLHSPSSAGSYLSGLSPRLRQRIDLATLMLRNGLGLATQREATEYSMLRGLEPYKLRWSPQMERNERVLLGGRALGTTPLYAAAITGRKRAVKLIKKALRREDHTAKDMRARLGDDDWTGAEQP